MECLMISGMSGAGKSVAADILEDIGYYCVDNMPAALIPRFAELFAGSGGKYKRCAFVIDSRGEEQFSELFDIVDALRAQGTVCRLLFLDCADEVLINRYKESRRQHPLERAEGLSLSAAVARERELTDPLRRCSDMLVDTSALPTAEFRAHLRRMFADDVHDAPMVIVINTFGYKHGIPHESDLVFDVRCLRNPYYVPELRDKTGEDAEVSDYVFSDETAEETFARLRDLLLFLIPLYIREGKTSLVISVGCTGGHHRSVAMGRRLQRALEQTGCRVQLRHRDIER